MQITRATIDQAIARNILSEEQGRLFWKFLTEKEQDTPTFKAAHILYYFGGFIAIGAMTLFMTLGWERFGSQGLLAIAVAYCAFALLLTELLLFRHKLSIPAGITAAFAIVMVPLAVYAIQNLLGYWPADGKWIYRDYHTRIDWRWIIMELATLGAGLVALYRYRLPFLVLPVAVTLWYMSMDLTPFLFGDTSGTVFSDHRKLVSLWFGLGMIVTAFWVDLRSYQSKDFAFWLYFFGVLTFWGGLSAMDSDNELGKLLYCGINLLMIAVGAMLSRRVFAVFGSIGVALYLGHLSRTVFEDSMLFPVALTAIGLFIVVAGVYWQRHESAIGERLRALLPANIRRLIAHRSA